MDLKPVNSINNDANTIRVSDGNSPIRLIFKDAKGEVINLYDKIYYFYLTKDNDKFYSVTDISYEGDEVIIRLPKLRKGKYKAEIRDKDGSIYPANEDLYILLRRSFEDDKDIYYFGHREDILNSVEPIIIKHIEQNPNKFKGERGNQGFPGRDGLRGIDGKDGKDGIDGDKGDPGKDGSMSFVDLTPEEKEQLRGERGRPGLDGKDGIDGEKGDPGKDGVDGIDGIDGKDGLEIVINENVKKYIPDDYATLTEAFNDLTKYKPGNNVTFEIIFKSSFKPSSGITLSNGDFSHFIISSEDEKLLVNDDFKGHFIHITNGTLPVLNTLVDMNKKGSDGLRLEGASKGKANTQSGILNAGGTGLYVRTSNFQGPYTTFSGCRKRNCWITRGANVSLASSDLSNPDGDRVAIYISRASILDASDCDISGGTAEYSNVHVLRSKVTLLGATIKNAYNDAVLASSGSEVTLRGGDLSNAGRNAIRCTGGSTIHLGDSINLSKAGEDAIYCSANSRVSGTKVNAQRCGKNSVVSKGGSIVYVPGINASNNLENGLYATDGSQIILSDTDDTGDLRSYINFNKKNGIYCLNGGKVVTRNTKISNNSDSGIYVLNGGYVVSHSTEIEKSTKYGIYCSGGSDLLIRSNSKNINNGVMDIYMAYGSKVISHGTPTTTSGSITPRLEDTNMSVANQYDDNKGILII